MGSSGLYAWEFCHIGDWTTRKKQVAVIQVRQNHSTCTGFVSNFSHCQLLISPVWALSLTLLFPLTLTLFILTTKWQVKIRLEVVSSYYMCKWDLAKLCTLNSTFESYLAVRWIWHSTSRQGNATLCYGILQPPAYLNFYKPLWCNSLTISVIT